MNVCVTHIVLDGDQVPQLGPWKGSADNPLFVTKLLFDLCVCVTSGYTSG